MNRKVVVLLVIFLCGFDKSVCNLNEDLREFENLVNVNSVVKSYLTFLQYEQFRLDITFLKSDDFRARWESFHVAQEVQDLLIYLHSLGLPIFEKINALAQLMGLPRVERQRFKKSNQGFKGFVDALKKSFPEEQFTALIESKLQASKDFQEMYANLKSEEYRTLYSRCMNTVQVQQMAHFMQTNNIHLEELLDVIRYLSG